MKRFFKSWWFLTGLAVVLLVLTLCVGLPFFVLSMRPMWIRITIGVSIVALWLFWAWWRRRKARKAAEAIEKELATPTAEDEESAAVAERMKEALASLKEKSGKKRDYLYSRPWYVIIGPPGAGKTTALLNSGLRFPFADQSVKGVGGTRNLDFWFAEEAAMVDTAGRYTTQDSDTSVDTQGWKSFLSLLKKHRPLSPINGVIVAIGVDELVKSDRAELDRHASLVRRRLIEMRSELEVSVPVYLLVTKADLIAGFCEYYDDLDVEGRRAVLGATLPVENKNPSIDDIVSEFDQLVNAQSERQAKRLFEEVDHARRSLILGYPAQLAALRSRLARFIDGAFVEGDTPTATLRGFYFTSGVQEGAPLDRILAGVADAFQSTTQASAKSGRTYFLNRLMTEVAFGEAGLVTADPSARRRQQRQLIVGSAAIATIAALVLTLWTISFFNNRAFLSELNEKTHSLAGTIRSTGVDLVEVRDTDPELDQVLPILNELRNLPQGYTDKRKGAPGLMMRFGLFQSSHADQAQESYRDALRRILLPRILLRIEQYMAANASDPMQLYQPLKAYMMLGGLGPMDKGTVKSWVTADWEFEMYPGADQAPVRKQLEEHLNALLEDEDGLASSWEGGRKAPLDGQTIASARAALQTLSMADRAYAVMKQKALASGGAPWRATSALAAGDAQAFANGDEVMQLEVPYFFTKDGFTKAYRIGLTTVSMDFRNDLWVLGEDSQTEGTMLQISEIRPNVARLYARDYIEAWEKVITTPKPADYFNNPAALGAFTKQPSPLKILLLDLRKHTTFGESGAANAVGQIVQERLDYTRMGRSIRRAQRVGSAGGAEGFDAGTEISTYFGDIHQYVGSSKNPGPLDEFVKSIRQAGSAVTSAKIAGGSMGSESAQGQMAMAMGGVATAAGGAPPLLQDFVASAAEGGATATVSTAQGALTEAYSEKILPECQTATADKYPFFGAAEEDASLLDVQRVFAMNGVLDAFVQQRIVPLLDMSGPIWRWNEESPQTANLSPSSPDEFAKARKLRDLLVAGIAVKIEPKTFGADVTLVDLNAGGTRYRFEKDEMEERPLVWSAQGGVPEASLTMYAPPEAEAAKPEVVDRIRESGPWALFRLMDNARLENTGPQSIDATFGQGAKSVVFRVSLPDKHNPFIRGGGVWSFRCPVVL
ncbi:type VI secretion protein [Novosphingobium marinum]|uniref:Type VI secretion system protein ImpL n=1 Tax=Novosphingobium marinum TaxID=1514948 RepID=A0A7Z0BWB6_9SPHN|nr:type VI secretion system membrane subunit TssM [Novosphingobium marinum]NYH96082.1 type VI secretion system protein ImpL [Novosphingobium marinum]GGC32320.1 type VI secretion protein [Novosphingobium marinum]